MSSKASLVTRDLADLTQGTGNIYQSVVIMSKRSRQISNKVKEELSSKLAEFATSIDTLDEIHENREQIEISRFYERLPKPSMLATQDFLEGKVYFVRTETKEQDDELGL